MTKQEIKKHLKMLIDLLLDKDFDITIGKEFYNKACNFYKLLYNNSEFPISFNANNNMIINFNELNKIY